MTLTSSKCETTDSFTMKREGQNSNCCNLILKMINSYYVVVPQALYIWWEQVAAWGQ